MNFTKVQNTHFVIFEIKEHISLTKLLPEKQQGNYKKELDYTKNLIN